MQFFVDTANIEEIRKLNDIGLVDGVTTNPSLIAKEGRDFIQVTKEICALISGPVSAEVTALDHATMMKEARKLAEIADNVTIKVPLTPDGIQTCKALTDDGIKVNVTLCFSTSQAILAAKAGATFISPFIGRLDDISEDGLALIEGIVAVYDNYAFETQVLVASVRSPLHVTEAAKIGADVATVPPKVLWQMFNHPLTDKGLEAFIKDWESTGQSIL